MSTANLDALEDMKSRLCAMFHRQNSLQMSQASRSRKLILHFDVNKTIVPVDTATGENVEDCLNVYLSGLAWGKDNAGVWESSRRELSPKPHDENDVSFYKFEERRLLRHLSQDRSTFRYHLSSFTDHPQGSNFKPYLNTLLEKLKWKEHYDEQLHKRLTIPGRRYTRYNLLLPAFLKLVAFLVENNREFAIVFRTFGNDVSRVLSALKTAFSGAIHSCANLKPFVETISDDVLTLQRDSNGFFRLKRDASAEICFTGKEKDMYTYFTGASGISAVQDDVHLWYRNNFHPTHGKPLWIDLNDTDTQHVFFDDNIRPGSEDSIVDLRLRECSDSDKFRNVERAEEYKFVDANLAQVNFAEAIMDDDYFINKLRICEDNYSTILHSHHIQAK